MKIRHLQLLLAAFALLFSVAASAGETGFVGFGILVDLEGFFLNQTLKTVTVNKVVPESPAEKAGLAVGDQIVEVEGMKVQGAKAYDLKPYLDVDVGKTVKMVIKKASGQLRAVSLTAVPMTG